MYAVGEINVTYEHVVFHIKKQEEAKSMEEFCIVDAKKNM